MIILCKVSKKKRGILYFSVYIMYDSCLSKDVFVIFRLGGFGLPCIGYKVVKWFFFLLFLWISIKPGEKEARRHKTINFPEIMPSSLIVLNGSLYLPSLLFYRSASFFCPTSSLSPGNSLFLPRSIPARSHPDR